MTHCNTAAQAHIKGLRQNKGRCPLLAFSKLEPYTVNLKPVNIM
jgi:hypothetical protein